MKKIEIQMHKMEGEKGRSKAMKIAAECRGVQSVSVEGESKDKLVVTGDGIDSVCLTIQLRKKFPGASITSVGDVKADKEKDKEKKEKTAVYRYENYPPPYPFYYVYDEPQPRSCFFF